MQHYRLRYNHKTQQQFVADHGGKENNMKKYYIGYHNKPWDHTDFTIMAETENEIVAMSIVAMYHEKYNEVGMTTKLVIYESRELPENAHY